LKTTLLERLRNGTDGKLSVEELVEKYYGYLKEDFNENVANELSEPRPYDYKIDLECHIL